MAESQILLTVLTSLCTFLLCYIFFPEIAASRNRRYATVRDRENAPLYLPPRINGGVARYESETPELQPEPGLVKETASQETTARPAEQISNNPDKAKRLLEILMEEICFGFALANAFNREDATSMFVIYAHDTKFKSADSRVVRSIIKYLKLSGSSTRSDRVPVLHSEDPESGARDDILVNQFCLLPEQIAKNPVKKVLLCYSRLLRDYYIDANSTAYIEEIKNAALRQIRELQASDNTITLNSQRILSIQNAIRVVVNRHTKKPWFHHVLTEIALVDLRVVLTKQPFKVIAVDLQFTETVLEDMSFLNSTQHYIVPPPKVVVKVDDSEQTHLLFFQLLERIYGELPPVVIWLQEAYHRGIKKLEDNISQADIVYRDALWLELREELWRAQIGGLRETPWSHRQPEEGEQQWDIPFFNLEPAKPLITPPTQIPAELLVQPTPVERECLHSLQFYEMQDRIETIEPPYDGTLEWLFHHPSYLSWLAQDSGMLGIRGGPGTGKSTALKAMIKREEPKAEATHLLLYFFFNGRDSVLQRTRPGMYRTLLYQLLSKVPSAGAPFWRWAERTAPDHISMSLNPDTLREMFLEALLAVCESARVRIFLDALDEAGDDEARAVIADLRRISKKVGLVARGLTICFACRYYPAIVVDNGLEIRLEDHNGEGIKLFTRSSLNKINRDFLNEDELRDLVESISDSSSGFFLWAKMAVDSVTHGYIRGYSPKSIRRDLDTLPADIHDLYSSMLEQIHFESIKDQEVTVTLIRWITFSRRPMTLEELRYALGWDRALDQSEKIPPELNPYNLKSDTSMLRMMEKYLQGFARIVETVGEDGQVKPSVEFIHHTVFEYFSGPEFLRRLGPGPWGGNWFGESHDRLAQTCYYFIKATHAGWFELGTKEIKILPFCDYAAQFCFIHAEEAERRGVPQMYLQDELGSKAGRGQEELLMQWAKAYGRANLAQRSLRQLPSWNEVAEAFKIAGRN